MIEGYLSLVVRKLTFWFPTWSDTNQAVQLQKMARGLKEFVLLRRAISLKVNYEKVKFSNCVFCDYFSDYKLTHM